MALESRRFKVMDYEKSTEPLLHFETLEEAIGWARRSYVLEQGRTVTIVAEEVKVIEEGKVFKVEPLIDTVEVDTPEWVLLKFPSWKFCKVVPSTVREVK